MVMWNSYVFLALCEPFFASALWKIDIRPYEAGLEAHGYACCPEAAPACAIAVAGVIIDTAMSGINDGQKAGSTGGQTRRGSSGPVTHLLPNGTSHRYLNTAALEVGRWHDVRAGGHTLLASRHPDGFNILRASLTSKRTDPDAIQDMSAQFGDRVWPMANQWTPDEISAMATDVIQTADLDAVQICSSISDDTDPDTFDMSWIFETLNKPYTEIPPPCGV